MNHFRLFISAGLMLVASFAITEAAPGVQPVHMMIAAADDYDRGYSDGYSRGREDGRRDGEIDARHAAPRSLGASGPGAASARAYAAGYADGYQKGYDSGYTEAINNALSKWEQKGYDDGYAVGLADGRSAKVLSLLDQMGWSRENLGKFHRKQKVANSFNTKGQRIKGSESGKDTEHPFDPLTL